MMGYSPNGPSRNVQGGQNVLSNFDSLKNYGGSGPKINLENNEM